MLVLVGFSVAVPWAGFRSWTLRVDVELQGREVVFTRRRRGGVDRQWRLERAAITDVDIEVDEGTSRIVVVAGGERWPLTQTSITKNQRDEVAALRAFLGLPPGADG